MTLTEEDNGKSIEVSRGEKVILRLNETPGTGFRWAVETGDDSIIVLHSSDYIQGATTAIGGSGQRIFVFETKRSGAGHLLLKLWREWEGDKSIASRFQVTIQVPN